MSGTNSQFSNTLNSIAFEHLTGLKPSMMSQPVTSSLSSNLSTASPAITSFNNGTGQWAAGMANAGDVLGTLGMTPSLDPNNSLARNTNWDTARASHDLNPKTFTGNNKVSLLIFCQIDFLLMLFYTTDYM